MDYFGDDEAALRNAAEELPKWFERERKDVERERDLYQREMALREKIVPTITEEYVDKKEAALERQIREYTRLLMQLKTKRSQWGAEIGTAFRPACSPEIGNRGQGTGDRV